MRCTSGDLSKDRDEITMFLMSGSLGGRDQGQITRDTTKSFKTNVVVAIAGVFFGGTVVTH